MNRNRLDLRRALTGLVLFVFTVGCASTSPPPPMGGTPPYRVGAPDRLQISVLPEPAIERDVIVRPDGMISIDLVGDIPAAGRTPSDIAADIEKRIGRYKRGAKVTVALAGAQSSAITLLGEIRAASFPLQKETRVAEAIGRVGGVSQYANQRSIRIIRTDGGETQVLIANLHAIQQGDLRTNYRLQSGDIIFVPPTLWAKIGHAIRAVTYPLTQLFGFGSSIATTVYTGGA